MATTIVVAGATGNLGRRIAHALLDRGAMVCALVRTGTGSDKLEDLQQRNLKIAQVDLSSVPALTQACAGASCVVSALQGLGDVIIDTQGALLEGAVKAGVPRFIPSDYSADFTKLTPGENRNFDLRRAFHERLDKAAIASTSILNGAFADMLNSGMPLLDRKTKTVSYWENADQPLDFTTMDDTAAFVAVAALDPSTPSTLRIAGDQITARELASVAGEVLGAPFQLVRSGSLDDLAGLIKRHRTENPESEKELYPMWQAMQYMHNMFSGRANLETLDNDRYPNHKWTSVREVIASQS